MPVQRRAGHDHFRLFYLRNHLTGLVIWEMLPITADPAAGQIQRFILPALQQLLCKPRCISILIRAAVNK